MDLEAQAIYEAAAHQPELAVEQDRQFEAFKTGMKTFLKTMEAEKVDMKFLVISLTGAAAVSAGAVLGREGARLLFATTGPLIDLAAEKGALAMTELVEDPPFVA